MALCSRFDVKFMTADLVLLSSYHLTIINMTLCLFPGEVRCPKVSPKQMSDDICSVHSFARGG